MEAETHAREEDTRFARHRRWIDKRRKERGGANRVVSSSFGSSSVDMHLH